MLMRFLEAGQAPGGRCTTEDVYRFSNTSDSVVDTHLLIIVRG
jgi:hypothetical protein